MSVLARETLRLTFALLAGSVALIAAGLAGFEGSLVLVGVLLVVAGGLYALRGVATELEPVWRYDPRPYAAVVWTGPLLAAVVLVLTGLGASAGELQALGGFLGLAGMANYFLRPVYVVLASLLGTARRAMS
jgi:hypothetical protein